jgi:hypothetical protein
LTYGDGDRWEVSTAIHFENWKNTDFDVSESGLGDLFIGGKYRFLAQEKGKKVDLSVLPYILIPTGNRDKSIGDLYLFNPTDEDDISYGATLLLGKRWNRFYLSGNLGINRLESDLDYIDDTTILLGLALEYHISESLNSYFEFINNENRNRSIYPENHSCYDADTDEDIREIGAGVVWLKNRWGFKFHTGIGLSETAPDIHVSCMVNYTFAK